MLPPAATIDGISMSAYFGGCPDHAVADTIQLTARRLVGKTFFI
jgi:hypothetical protein